MASECLICCRGLHDRLRVTLPCSTASATHMMCMGCFIHLRARSCPFCRAPFESSLPHIQEETRRNLIAYLQATGGASEEPTT